MKCVLCDKPVKGLFKQCFQCNKKKSLVINFSDIKNNSECDFINDNVSESIDEKPYKKQSIPKAVKVCLWKNYFNNSLTGICQCCLREPISINNYDASHIMAERKGGETTLDNLKPCCRMCNLSMGTMDMNEFIKKYNLHYGL